MSDPSILILFYSLYGATQALAECIAEGVKSEGFQSKIRTVPPMHAATEPAIDAIASDGPLYATLDGLIQCSALALGSPTRFANIAAPLKPFIDSTRALWQNGTLLSMMLSLFHHGMLILGLPSNLPALLETKTGGTPYRPTHLASTPDRSLDLQEKICAVTQGKRLALITKKLLTHSIHQASWVPCKNRL